MEEILYNYNPWWEEEFDTPGLINRPLCLDSLKKNFSSNEVILLTGLRRVGKTTLIKLFIKHLIKKEKIDPKHIFYVSLDDYTLLKNSILEIINEYRKINKIRHKEKIYIFLDEITYKDDFELQLKNIYDSQNVKIYAISSSASILKSKKPYLVGRSKTIEILPLDFDEYLTFKQIKISKRDEHLKEKYFEDYLKDGGMPEYVLRDNIEYLKELVDDIIQKDIAVPQNIKNVNLLKDFFLLLMEKAGKILSINKIARILDISPDTAKRYLQMFEDTFLIYTIPRYGKTNQKILSPKKIYAADLGIRTYFTRFRDKGSLFENYIFLKIKNQKPCYVYSSGIEIDFLMNNTLIEAKYGLELSDKQLKLFNKTKAKEKFIINNYKDLEKFMCRKE